MDIALKYITAYNDSYFRIYTGSIAHLPLDIGAPRLVNTFKTSPCWTPPGDGRVTDLTHHRPKMMKLVDTSHTT